MYKQTTKQHDTITSKTAVVRALRRAVWKAVKQAAIKRITPSFQPFAY